MRAPTPHLDQLLNGPAIWSSIEWHDEVTSTNEVAAAHVDAGGPAGFVVVADIQTAGRGRLDRTWVDVGRDDEHASLLVSAVVPVPSRPTLAPLAAGLAVFDAAKRRGADASLKWPNDLLLGDRKAGGILVEHRTPDGHPPALVIGMGVNLDWRGQPHAQQEGWTSVAEDTGRDCERWGFLGDVLGSLDAWLRDVDRDPVRFLAFYRSRCRTIGREVIASTPAGEIRGVARDLDGSGALLVETKGETVPIRAGDVTHVRAVS